MKKKRRNLKEMVPQFIRMNQEGMSLNAIGLSFSIGGVHLKKLLLESGYEPRMVTPEEAGRMGHRRQGFKFIPNNVKVRDSSEYVKAATFLGQFHRMVVRADIRKIEHERDFAKLPTAYIVGRNVMPADEMLAEAYERGFGR